MSVRRFLAAWTLRSTARPTPHAAVRRSRPQLEALESRVVLSDCLSAGLTVTASVPDATAQLASAQNPI